MKFTTTNDVADFAAQVLPALHQDQVRHTVILSVIDGIQRGTYEDYRLGCVVSNGDVMGVAVWTPPHSAFVSVASPDVAQVVVDGIRDWDPPGVVGLTPDIDHVVARLDDSALTKLGGRRLFRLDELIPPAPAKGKARYATYDDVELIAQWLGEFADSIDEGDHSIDRRPLARARVERGRVALWERDGEVVSMVGRTEFLADTARIAPVYTPEELRGNGYASNLVARVSADIQQAGKTPLLFTELSNPTSNKIYQAIGYRPVGDSYEARFAQSPDS